MNGKPETANEYADFWRNEIGVNIIPADAIKKVPKVTWTEWQQKPIPQETHDKWKADNLFDEGMAVICGKVFHNKSKQGLWINMIDCDNKLAIDEFTRNGIEQISQNTLTEQHANPEKAHMYYYTDRAIESKPPDNDIDDTKPKIEIKSRGVLLSYCTPSPHKDGSTYEIVGVKEPKKIDAEMVETRITDICNQYGLKYSLGLKQSTDKSDLIKGNIPEGGRHNSALWYVNHLLFKAKLDAKTAKFEFERWNSSNKPPLTQSEIDRIFSDAVSYHHHKKEEEVTQEEEIEKISEDELARRILDKKKNALTSLKPDGEFILDIDQFKIRKLIEKNYNSYRGFLKEAVIIACMNAKSPNLEPMKQSVFKDEYKGIKLHLTGNTDTTVGRLSGRKHEAKIVVFTCEVVTISEPLTETLKGEYYCESCDDVYELEAGESRLCEDHRSKPKMKLMRNLETQDFQYVYVRDNATDNVKQAVSLLTLMARGGYVSKHGTNDLLKVIGFFTSVPDKNNKNKITINVIDMEQTNDVKNIMPSPELLKKIKLHVLDKSLLDHLTEKSFAYGVYGYTYEKLSVLMTTVRSRKAKNTRDTLNLFLLGSPGKAKTTLLKQLSLVGPKVVRTSAEGASGVGLTASLVNTSDGTRILSPGALVMASGGVGIIDEFDKLEKDHRKSLVSVMEEKVVYIDKADKLGTLNADTAVILAANPRDGKWNDDRTLMENVGLDRFGVILLSRCDLIFRFPDTYTREEKRKIMQRINEYENKGKPEGAFTDEEITAYLNWANGQPDPKFTAEVDEYLNEFFLSISDRTNQDEKNDLDVEFRQYHGLRRISSILAKMHGQKEVDIWCAEKAVEIFKYGVGTFGMSLEQALMQGTLDTQIHSDRQVFETCFVKVRDNKTLLSRSDQVIEEMKQCKKWKKPGSAQKYWDDMIEAKHLISWDGKYKLSID